MKCAIVSAPIFICRVKYSSHKENSHRKAGTFLMLPNQTWPQLAIWPAGHDPKVKVRLKVTPRSDLSFVLGDAPVHTTNITVEQIPLNTSKII